MRRGRFRWDHFAVALAISTAFNVTLLPLLKPFGDKPDEAVEVAFLDDTPSPEKADDQATAEKVEIPPPDKSDPPAELALKSEPEPKRPEPKRPEPKKPEEKPPEVAKVEPPKPELPKPLVPPPPLPPPPPPPPLALPPKMKMVSQEKFDEEPDNTDAHYLAEKNHRAAEDTRTNNTNLVHEVQGENKSSSEPNQNQDSNVGSKDQKVAELEERKGLENQIVRGQPRRGDDGQAKPRAEAPQKPSKLAMRDLVPRAAEKTPGQQRDGLELHDDAPGPLPAGRVGDGGERARAAQRGAKVRLTLDHNDYDKIMGEAVASKERRDAARAEISHAKGRWDRVSQKIAMMRSTLENFTPDAKVGNQAELGTRAHPFAGYIAEMHRSIHKLWAFGFLAELDGKSPTAPMNDMDLWTQLEIVIKPDGDVEKITIVRPSGYAPFDTAAMDSVMSSAPFRSPPDVIKSANGKVYLDWKFHRDDRQCTTAGVDPHILTDVGDNKQHDVTALPTDRNVVAPPRVLHRPRLAPAVASGPPQIVPAAAPGSAPAPSSGPASRGDAVPDAARDAAQGWFGAYVRGDAGWLAGWSASPMTAAGEIVARDGDGVKKLYAQLLREAPRDRRLDKLEVYSAQGLRAKMGGLPPGGESDGGMMFAVGEIGKEQFVLLLKKSDQGWRVCGIDR